MKTQIFPQKVEAVKSKDYALAADIFEELAVSGDMDAQFNYAILVRNGLEGPKITVKLYIGLGYLT